MKSSILKSAITSAMLVVLVIAIVPLVSAEVRTDYSQTSDGDKKDGEGVGGGVQGNWDGNRITWGIWHAGRWLGGIAAFSGPLYYTTYRNGLTYSSGSVYDDHYDIPQTSGSWTSIGIRCSSSFSDPRFGTFAHSIGTVTIP
ncbi:MAG: hypothetical protein GX799_00325 [Crenarchaeota archaeon]|nr:hypothetical protein [Thermoproteota archaeon]